jgi:SAM-dependent methyltransferase
MQVKSAEQGRLYTDLVWTWPIISPWEDYVEETEALVKRIKEFHSDKLQTILNLGCGGGHNDKTLKKYFQVTGLDLSAEMLTLARKLNPECTYLNGDMRTARLDNEYDVVVVFDSLAHMLSEQDLKAAFNTAFAHLRPGGIFCTYREFTPEHFIQNMTRTSVHQGDDIEIVLIENEYDPDPHDFTFESTMVYLTRCEGHLYIETDRGLNGLFPLKTWTRLLTDAGFRLLESELDSEGCGFFFCLKPNDGMQMP